MEPTGSTATRSYPSSWQAFAIWVVLGAVGALGFLTLAVIGLVPIIGIVWIGTRPSVRNSWFGGLAGVGAALLFVAYLQRRGPGPVCWHTATASGCDDYMNPWPWLIAGVALIAIAVIAQVRRMRTDAGHTTR